MPGGLELLACGWSNNTPWQTPREESEDDLYARLDALAQQVSDPRRAVFMIHVPPHDSGLDTAPILDENLRPTVSAGDVLRGPVGSTAVRRIIEAYQPVLAIHGHIHESGGERKIGKTVCINPGSEANHGILRGLPGGHRQARASSYPAGRGVAVRLVCRRRLGGASANVNGGNEGGTGAAQRAPAPLGRRLWEMFTLWRSLSPKGPAERWPAAAVPLRKPSLTFASYPAQTRQGLPGDSHQRSGHPTEPQRRHRQRLRARDQPVHRHVLVDGVRHRGPVGIEARGPVADRRGARPAGCGWPRHTRSQGLRARGAVRGRRSPPTWCPRSARTPGSPWA